LKERKVPLLPQLKFLLDEDVSNKTLRRLRKQKLTVESVRTLGLQGIKNSALLDYIISHGFILITHDQDFVFPSRSDHLGIILVMAHPATDAHAGVILENFLTTVDSAVIIGKLVFLKEDSWNMP
jgi:predicted nuclease of predicted toxin-antitoxin system